MRRQRSIWFFVVALVVCGAVLGGCNTMEGLGKDVQKAGEKIEGSAK